MINVSTIFLDLDGVMADFETYFEQYFGIRHDSVDDNKMWEMIHNHGHFFRNLPPMAGAVEFYEVLKAYGRNVMILTGCPRKNYDIAATQKKEWVAEHLDPDVHVLPVIGGKNKHLFLHRKNDILIDDFEKNILPWQKAGGIGIIHTSFEKTKTELAAYLK